MISASLIGVLRTDRSVEFSLGEGPCIRPPLLIQALTKRLASLPNTPGSADEGKMPMNPGGAPIGAPSINTHEPT